MTTTITKRRTSEALEQRIGEIIPVDTHGWVILRDYMGTDETIEEAARQSYGEGRAVSSRRNLLRYLYRERHTSPFEMAEVQLQVKVPMAIGEQWLRHRTANVNKLSGRYSEMPMEMYLPAFFHNQSPDNKQGSGYPLTGEAGEHAMSIASQTMGVCREAYEQLLLLGVAKEEARFVLPASQYTVMTWKCDVHNLLHFLALRLHNHAQLVIRQYAQIIASLVKEWLPLTWEAFEDYRLHARNFSRQELVVLQELAKKVNHAELMGIISEQGMSQREQGELFAVLTAE